LLKEINSSPAGVKLEVKSFVDSYGKETKGFVNYAEFKEIYVTHVAPII
jgi:hypothetical protein